MIVPYVASPGRPRRFRFGLRAAFVVLTVVAIGLGAFVVRQNRLAAAQRRYDQRWAKLESLLLTGAPTGFDPPLNYTTVLGLGRRPRYIGWSVTLAIPALKSTLSTTALVSEVLGYYQLGFNSLGLRAGGSGPMRSQIDLREIYLDENGAPTLILDYEFDAGQQRIEIDALWISDPR